MIYTYVNIRIKEQHTSLGFCSLFEDIGLYVKVLIRLPSNKAVLYFI